MRFKLLSAVVLAAVFGVNSVEAQSVARVGGPANLPPPGFTGQQFIDNRGCVFLRAGYGGQITWVPRVGSNRKAMCGLPPSSAARAAIEVASEAEAARPAPLPAPKPVVMAAPMAAPAPKVIMAAKPAPVLAPPVLAPTLAAPVAVAVPSRSVPSRPAPSRPAPYVAVSPSNSPRMGYEVASGSGPAQGQIGCYSSAPVAERVKTRNGGTTVVCTRGDGTLTGWRPPVYPRSAGVGAALTDPAPAIRANRLRADDGVAYAAASDAIPTPPKGYKLAWEDGRLNPNRGKGTAAGWAAQDQVWDRKVPSKLVVEAPTNRKKRKAVYVQPANTVSLSTKGQAMPVKPVKPAKGGAYIQVGTFGVVANAEGASARLAGIGLPVARAKITSGGKPMQIVMAGPFRSAADAQTALAMARSAGFGDAFIR